MLPDVNTLLDAPALAAFGMGLLVGFQRSRWLLVGALCVAFVLLCHHLDFDLPAPVFYGALAGGAVLGVVGLFDSLLLLFVPAEVASDRLLNTLCRCVPGGRKARTPARRNPRRR